MIQLAPLKDIGIQAWGDSLVEATANSNPLDKRWTQLLAKTFRRNITVYNGGVGGETATQVETRQLAYLPTNTQINIIWVGRNGVLTLPPATILTSIQNMVNHVGDNRFIVISVINKTDGTEDTGSANAILIDNLNLLIQSTFPGNYLNLRTLLDSDSTRGIDELHLNVLGNEIVASNVYNFIINKQWIKI